MPMTNAGLRRMLKGWQRRLGMTDWRITISFVSKATLAAHHGVDMLIYGDTQPCPERHSAKVRICDPVDTPEGEAAVESTVVHELLHVLLDPRSVMAGDSSFETGLDLVSKALTKR